MNAAGELELWLPHNRTRTDHAGRPYTRHEPLWNSKQRRAYPHPKTAEGLAAWQRAWFFDAKQARVASPIVLEVYVRSLRPQSHFSKRGELTPAGKNQPFPSGWDLSNVVKLVEDALKNKAFGDDAEIVALHSAKRWVSDAAMEGTWVSIRTAAPG